MRTRGLVHMVASRVVKVNDAIAQKAADAMGKIEGAVVGGYTKIEDRFVEAYLTHEGETVEQAKERLRREEAERKVVKAVSADAHGASDGAATGAERVHLRKLRSGQSFLYREGGYNSTVVEVRMTERVSGSCLQSALTRVSRRFPTSLRSWSSAAARTILPTIPSRSSPSRRPGSVSWGAPRSGTI